MGIANRGMGNVRVTVFLVGLLVAGISTGQTTTPARRMPSVSSQGAEPATAIVSTFDLDGNQRLEYSERTAARKLLDSLRAPSQPAKTSRNILPGSPGPKLLPNDVVSITENVPLYDLATVRTLFLIFEHDDWEQELADFWHTDVLIDGSLEMDGKSYADVGISFRGNNSFSSVPKGSKRSLSIKLDFVNDQNLLGYRELKLLNANQDPTFLRTFLYLHVAQDYLPALNQILSSWLSTAKAGASMSTSSRLAASLCGMNLERKKEPAGNHRTIRMAAVFRIWARISTPIGDGTR